MPDKAVSVDRTVTLSLVFAVIIQTTGALLWAGSAEARIEALEAQHNFHPPVSERLARIEEQMIMTRQSLVRIETRIETRSKDSEP
ncbi:hypothetical protein [Fretibacter rubidus]|uniref:hypothetical protein n=1 Tax=Fretibacter rubidus TaxID=570162 RepID=UPI00352B8EBA